MRAVEPIGNTPRTDLASAEYLLKREMAKELITIQFDRAKGDRPYVPAVEKYGEYARVLRAILLARGREGYVKIRELHMVRHDHHRLEDMDFEGARNLFEILESFHETGSAPVVR